MSPENKERNNVLCKRKVGEKLTMVGEALGGRQFAHQNLNSQIRQER